MMGHYAGPAFGFGYWGEPAEDLGYWGEPAEELGYFGEELPYAMDGYGYWGHPQELVGWGAPFGYYAEDLDDDFGDWGEVYEPAEMGWYGEEELYGPVDDLGWYGEEELYGPEDDLGWYGEEELYGPEDDLGWYGEEPEFAEYDPTVSGYVREVEPPFNPAIVAATNLGGYGLGYAEEDLLAGYVKPSTVNATCGQFTAQPGVGGARSLPPTLEPLW